MNDLAYAWRSLWRNRRRTFITLAAIALSIMLVQAFHNLSIGTYAQMIDSGVRAGSGHLAVYRDGYLAGRTGRIEQAARATIEDRATLERERMAYLRAFSEILSGGT